jgi:hemoglobin-like flavoprotein
MEMAPADVERVRQSYALVRCVGATAARLFYQRLLELEPPVHSQFVGDWRVQRVRLLANLQLLVDSLDYPPALLDFAQRLDTTNDALGLLLSQREIGSQALLWMLRRVLGPGFTPEVRRAWQQAIATLQAALPHEEVPAPASTNTPNPCHSDRSSEAV